MEEEDSRFNHIVTDPKFRRIPRKDRKIKIDKRFGSMFQDRKFKTKYAVDKRGRPVNFTSTEDLKRYYELSSEDEESSEEEQEDKYVKAPKEEDNSFDTKHASDKTIPQDIKKKLRDLKVDYARGEATLYSESSSDDEETEEEVEESDDIEHKWGELDADAEHTDTVTYRLAACNMDWDRIRAIDLMVLFNSFLPPGGSIKSVVIYPSEFGKQRMQEEEVRGPIELVETKADEEEEENEEGAKYHMEKLRQYQLNRLKYYYAVITFDSENTANKIYTECDGMEYESSATKMDLRFIPDDMTFDEEPKEKCEKLPEFNKYQPRFFTTTALQQAKVDLTWDETNPDRLEVAQKLSSGKVDDVTEADLQEYLASSSDEDEEEEKGSSESEMEDPVNKYKSLLQEIEEKEKKAEENGVEMEVTWGTNLAEKTEKLVKERLDELEKKTPFQEYLDKRKQKRKERKNKHKSQEDTDESDIPSDVDMNDPYFAEEFNKAEFKKPRKAKKAAEDTASDDKTAELELLLSDEDDNKKHFSLDKIQKAEEMKSKKKKKKKNEEGVEKDDFKINVDDQRFSAIFTSHHYNIDPTDSHFKKTSAMETLIKEKLKRRASGNEEVVEKVPRVENKRDPELSVLVKSVKRKTEKFGSHKK